MAQTNTAAPYDRRPFADRAAHVTATASFAWLAAGLRDFKAAFGTSLAYGMIFVLTGIVLTATVFAANMAYLFVPLATGFMLVGPAATLGFYAISRDLEAGRRPNLGNALQAFRANPGPLLYVGAALLGIFMVWLRMAQLTYALAFQTTLGLDAHSLLYATLFTGEGRAFLAISMLLGGLMAVLVFAGTAFALPMLLDRPVGMAEAVATSWTAVGENLPAMTVWAILLVALTALGMAAGFVGLAVTLPLAGHATWHAYRAVVR